MGRTTPRKAGQGSFKGNASAGSPQPPQHGGAPSPKHHEPRPPTLSRSFATRARRYTEPEEYSRCHSTSCLERATRGKTSRVDPSRWGRNALHPPSTATTPLDICSIFSRGMPLLTDSDGHLWTPTKTTKDAAQNSRESGLARANYRFEVFNPRKKKQKKNNSFFTKTMSDDDEVRNLPNSTRKMIGDTKKIRERLPGLGLRENTSSSGCRRIRDNSRAKTVTDSRFENIRRRSRTILSQEYPSDPRQGVTDTAPSMLINPRR